MLKSINTLTNYFQQILFCFITFFNLIYSNNTEEYIYPDIKEFQLDNGMHVLISPNYDNPLINIRLIVNVGILDEPLDKPGLAVEMIKNLLNGTEKYSNKKTIKEKIFSFGDTDGNLKTYYIDNENIFIDQIFLKRDTKDAIEFFSEIIRRPTFDNTGGIIKKYSKRFFYRLIPGDFNYVSDWEKIQIHSNYMFNNMFSPINAKLFSYTKKEVKNWYFQYFRPEYTTLMISGDVNIINIKKLIKKNFGDWKSDQPLPDKRNYNINITNNSGIKIRFINTNLEQAGLQITKRTTALGKFWDPAGTMAQIIFNEIPNNRIDMIRKKMNNAGSFDKGWLISNRMPYAYNTYWINYSYLNDLYSEFIKEFKSISNNSIKMEELEAAKIWRINQYNNTIYDLANLNQHVLYYYTKNGYSIENLKNMQNDIRNVTLEEVHTAAKKIYDPENFVMVLTGKKDSCSTFLSQFESVQYYNSKDEINKYDKGKNRRN